MCVLDRILAGQLEWRSYQGLYPDDYGAVSRCLLTNVSRQLTITFNLGRRLEVLLPNFLGWVSLWSLLSHGFPLHTMMCLHVAQKLTFTLNLE